MRQIHSGKRTFSRQEDAGGDAARFEREWLEILRSLERDGKIMLSGVVCFHRDGNEIPEKVDVVSVRVPPS
jgi:hypothetical protein